MYTLEFKTEMSKNIAELMKHSSKVTLEMPRTLYERCSIDKDVYDKVEPERRDKFLCCQILEALDSLEKDKSVEISTSTKDDRVVIITELKQ